MNRRERLLASILGPEVDETKAKMLDTTIKFILGDMGMQYTKLVPILINAVKELSAKVTALEAT